MDAEAAQLSSHATLVRSDIPFWAHLALAGSTPFRLGWALAIRSPALDEGSKSSRTGEDERVLRLLL